MIRLELRNSRTSEIYKKISKIIKNNGINVQKFKQFFNNLNSRSITDTKTFWKTVKRPFSSKCKTANILHENNSVI